MSAHDDSQWKGDAAAARAHVLGAAAWMSGALASFTLIAIAGREAARGATTGTIMFYRSWFALGVMLVVIAISRRGFAQFRTAQIGTHGLRSVIHFGAQYSWLFALPLIPLTELFAIEFTAPLWTALMAPLLLGERLTALRTAAISLGFSGALVVIRPHSAEISVGTMFALFAAIGFSVHYVITKKLMRRDPALTVIFYMVVFQAALATLLLTAGQRVPDAATAGWILVIAVCGLTAHFSIARAFALADAIIVTPMDFLRLPLIALVGVALYAEPLDSWVLAGGAMVVLANFINIWSERRRPA
jgi:drug/metabolite transporter (DMT)-like permease